MKAFTRFLRQHRKTVTSIALAVSLLLLLFPFLQSAFFEEAVTPNSPPPPRAGDAVTLEFWTLQLRDFAPLIEGWIARFERQHPKIRIHWVDVPFSEGEKRALSAMLGPNVPDVVNLNPAFASTLAQRKALLPVPQTLLNVDAYAPALLDMVRLNGTPYMLPWYTTTRLHFYNQSLITEAAAREALQSQRAFEQVETLKAQNAYLLYPLISSGGNLLKGLNPPLETIYTRETFRAALEERLAPIRQSMLKGAIPKEAMTGGYGDALSLYMAGRLAILEAGSSALGNIERNAPGVYARTAILSPEPLLQASLSRVERIDASPMVLVVPKKSKHPQAALAFAKFITSTENQLALAKEAPILPATLAGLSALQNEEAKGAKTLSQRAVLASAEKLRMAEAGYAIAPNQPKLNDLANAAAQAYLLYDTEKFEAYTERLWRALAQNRKD